MPEGVKKPETEYERRDRQAGDFWPDYIYGARDGSEVARRVPKEMKAALTEVFRKIDDAVAKAVQTGYVFFRYRSAYEHPELTTLIFSDGHGKQFQRTLRIDERFTINGEALHFHDYWWLRVALTSVIVNEGKVRRDPRGGWIPDEIIDNVGELKSQIEADKSGMLRLKLSVEKEK